MDFDWKQIAGPLLKIGATAAGTLVGGPAGAAIGGMIGPAIGAAFGLGEDAEPEAVAAAIEANPEKAKEVIATVEKERATDIRAAIAEAEAKQIESVNATMRVEAMSENWITKNWRPVFGMAFCVVWTAHGFAMLPGMLRGDFSLIAQIPSLTIFYGVPGAVVGVYAWKRSEEKIAGVAGRGVQGALAQAASAAIGAVIKSKK